MALHLPPDDPKSVRMRFNLSKHEATKARLEKAEIEEYQRTVEARMRARADAHKRRKEAEADMMKEDTANWKANRQVFQAARDHERRVEADLKHKRDERARRANEVSRNAAIGGIGDFEENLKRLGIDEEGGARERGTLIKLDDAEYIESIRQRKLEEVAARKERGKRKQKMILDQQKVQRMIQEDQVREHLLEQIVRQSKDERRLAADLNREQQRKAVAQSVRCMQHVDHSQKQLADEQEAAAASVDARERERKSRHAAMCDAIDEQRAALSTKFTVKHAHRERFCTEVAHQVFDLAWNVLEYRKEIDQAGTGVFGQRPMVPTVMWRGWMQKFVAGGAVAQQEDPPATASNVSPEPGSTNLTESAADAQEPAPDEQSAVRRSLLTPEVLAVELDQYLTRSGDWAGQNRAPAKLWNQPAVQMVRACEHAVRALGPVQGRQGRRMAVLKKSDADGSAASVAGEVEYVADDGAEALAVVLLVRKPFCGGDSAAKSAAARLNMKYLPRAALIEGALAARRSKEQGVQHGGLFELLMEERAALGQQLSGFDRDESPAHLVAAVAANYYFWYRAAASAANEPVPEATSPPKGAKAPAVVQAVPDTAGAGLLFDGFPSTAKELALFNDLVVKPAEVLEPDVRLLAPVCPDDAPLLADAKKRVVPDATPVGGFSPATSPAAASLLDRSAASSDLPPPPDDKLGALDSVLRVECSDAVALGRFFDSCPAAGDFREASSSLREWRSEKRSALTWLARNGVRTDTCDAADKDAVPHQVMEHVSNTVQHIRRRAELVVRRRQYAARRAEQGVDLRTSSAASSVALAFSKGDAADVLESWDKMTEEFRARACPAISALWELRSELVQFLTTVASEFRAFLCKPDNKQVLVDEYVDESLQGDSGFQPKKAIDDLQAALWAEVDSQRDAALSLLLDAEGEASTEWPGHRWFDPFKAKVEAAFKQLLTAEVERSACTVDVSAQFHRCKVAVDEEATPPQPSADGDQFLAALELALHANKKAVGVHGSAEAAAEVAVVRQRESALLEDRLNLLCSRYYAFRERVVDETALVHRKMRRWLSGAYRAQMAAISSVVSAARSALADGRALSMELSAQVAGPALVPDDSSLLTPIPADDLLPLRPFVGGGGSEWITRDQMLPLAARLRSADVDGVVPLDRVLHSICALAAASSGSEHIPAPWVVYGPEAVAEMAKSFDWAGKGVLDWRLMCLSMALGGTDSANPSYVQSPTTAQLQRMRQCMQKAAGEDGRLTQDKYSSILLWFEEEPRPLLGPSKAADVKDVLWHVFCDDQADAALPWERFLLYLCLDEQLPRAAEKACAMLAPAKAGAGLDREGVWRLFHTSPYVTFGTADDDDWCTEQIEAVFASVHGLLGSKPQAGPQQQTVSFAQLLTSHVGKYLLSRAAQLRRRDVCFEPVVES
eukprot:TRINITY_DN24320_c0_g1_i1.p1 TRINITY_DN24320_c0_g1~~TRINITY_DN24320_c0_g1_i1.p1  ORF type:complete len:1432 (+),score=534.38 TRINITY_DN24320_c0_g1_i1:39-4298(+)